MKSIFVLAALALFAAQSHGQVIPVPTFGPIASSTFVGLSQGQTFGDSGGWTVTGYGSSVDLIGGLWQSPDGLQNVDMDGASVGQMTTTLTIPSAGTVTVDFWLSGNPDGSPVTKTLDVALGSSDQQDTYTLTDANNVETMNWILVSMVFANQSAGQESLTFTSLDDALGTAGDDWGPVVGTVTAFDSGDQDQNNRAPDGGTTAMLLGMGVAGMAWLRRRVQ